MEYYNVFDTQIIYNYYLGSSVTIWDIFEVGIENYSKIVPALSQTRP
jgi:hypothetical protein